MSEKLSKIEVEVPAFLKLSPDETIQGSKHGYLDDEEGVFAPPRLKILNAMSEEVQSGGHAQGQYWSDYHEQTLGKKVLVTPILFRKEWIQFDDNNHIEWRSSNRNDPRVLEGDNHWKCLTINLILRVDQDEKGNALSSPDDPVLLVFALRSTGLKDMNELYKLAKKISRDRGVPLYGQRYELGCYLKSTPKGKHFAMSYRFAGYVDNEEDFKQLEEIHAAFLGSNIQPTYNEPTVPFDDNDF